MWVKEVNLINFRNYKNENFKFQKGINFIKGSNAIGKTSLVESIGYLSMCKSFKTNNDLELINEDSEEGMIKVLFENKIEETLKIVISKQGKYIELNGCELKKVSELVGNVKTITFLPKDVNFFKESPVQRRKFVDSNISMVDKVYLKTLSEYNKILINIKELLKNNLYDEECLNVYVGELIKRSYFIQQKRNEFIINLNDELKKVSKNLDEYYDMKLIYQPNVKKNQLENYSNEFKLKFDELLKEKSDPKKIPGIHHDDIMMNLNGKKISVFGSQGQNRLGVIALKLGLFDLIKRIYNEQPILILDDVLSELDKNHQNNLINILKNIEQVFITGTEVEIDNIDNLIDLNKVLGGNANGK